MEERAPLNISDIEVAKQISSKLLDINSRLAETYDFVKNRVPHEESKEYGFRIGWIVNFMFEEILEPVYRTHPSLKPAELDM